MKDLNSKNIDKLNRVIHHKDKEFKNNKYAI